MVGETRTHYYKAFCSNITGQISDYSIMKFVFKTQGGKANFLRENKQHFEIWTLGTPTLTTLTFLLKFSKQDCIYSQWQIATGWSNMKSCKSKS